MRIKIGGTHWAPPFSFFRWQIHYDEIGVTVTENGAMSPSATVSGLIIAAPGARYFTIGHLTDEARADYARRRGLTPHALARFLPR